MGAAITRALLARGEPVILLSRSAPDAATRNSAASFFVWDGLRWPPHALRNAGAVVHLAGEPLFGALPTPGHRARVWASRVDATRNLVRELEAAPAAQRPRVLVCASAVGYYGARGESALAEDAAAGAGFLAELCVEWERAAARARELGLRVVSLRYGVVLSRGGGALARLVKIFKLGLGGPLGDGQQFFPWIHLDDAVALTLRAITDARLDGAVNAVAPQVVRNDEFSAQLGRALACPTRLRTPAFLLRAALGAFAGELLDSRRVRPTVATRAGFRWQHPTLESALRAEFTTTADGGRAK